MALGYADVNAAPAGLLSDIISCDTAEILETAILDIYAGMTVRTEKIVGLFSAFVSSVVPGSGMWVMTFYKESDAYGFITATKYGSGIYMMARTINGGVWQPWEWINPPMNAGAEYRTTERYMGKPVYVKLINTGTLPDNTTQYVDFKDSDGNFIPVEHLVSLQAQVRVNTNYFMSVPDNSGHTEVFFSKYKDTTNEVAIIVKNTSSNWSANGWYMLVTIKYTKTTD